MFGKKKPPPPPPAPITLQVLTTEYLIEGQADPEGQFYIPNSEKYWGPIVLTDATLKASGLPATPPHRAARFELMGNAVVALIPRTDITRMPQYGLWKQYEYARQGVFYIGPYVILGMMKFMGKELFDDACPMEEVVITHRLPGAGLGEIRAPFVWVNTRWMSGYEAV